MIWLEKNILLLVVFITGAAVLVVEVTATRILSPFYGNTIYTVSSIISVVLGALSLGYYLGGRLADRCPTRWIFYLIILLSGLAVFLLDFLALAVLPFLSSVLPVISGSLVCSLLLFFLPSFLLGMLSPFAIKLQTLVFKNSGVGSISGSVFFWSTLGSIFGSLTAGFWFIPHFGVRQIVAGVGVVLLFIGALGLAASQKFKNLNNKITFWVVICFLAVLGWSLSPERIKAVYTQDGVYEKIIITDGQYHGQPVRFLFQDKNNSAAMFLNNNDPQQLVFDYTKYYSLYQIFKPQIEKALVLGGGGYSVPKALLADFPTAQIDVCEVEPSLFALAQKYFRVPVNSHLTNYVKDARLFLATTDEKYDLIYGDAYLGYYSLPINLTTKEFFNLVYDHLTPGGVFIVNFIGSLDPAVPSLTFSEIKTFRSVFPSTYFFAVKSLTEKETQNLVFVGHKSEQKVDINSAEIKSHPDSLIAGLPERQINLDQFDFSGQIELTDNYAPIEYLLAKMLEKHL